MTERVQNLSGLPATIAYSPTYHMVAGDEVERTGTMQLTNLPFDAATIHINTGDKHSRAIQMMNRVYADAIEAVRNDPVTTNLFAQAHWGPQQRTTWEQLLSYHVRQSFLTLKEHPTDQQAFFAYRQPYNNHDVEETEAQTMATRNINAMTRGTECDCEHLSLMQTLVMQRIERDMQLPVQTQAHIDQNDFKTQGRYYLTMGMGIPHDAVLSSILTQQNHVFIVSALTGNITDATPNDLSLAYSQTTQDNEFARLLAGYPTITPQYNYLLASEVYDAHFVGEHGLGQQRLDAISRGNYAVLAEMVPQHARNYTQSRHDTFNTVRYYSNDEKNEPTDIQSWVQAAPASGLENIAGDVLSMESHGRIYDHDTTLRWSTDAHFNDQLSGAQLTRAQRLYQELAQAFSDGALNDNEQAHLQQLLSEQNIAQRDIHLGEIGHGIDTHLPSGDMALDVIHYQNSLEYRIEIDSDGDHEIDRAIATPIVLINLPAHQR